MNSFLSSITPEKIFILFFLLFGSLFMATQPPFQTTGEEEHFYRAYQISEGNWFVTHQGEMTGGEIPSSLKTVAEQYRQFKPDPNQLPQTLQSLITMFSYPLVSEQRSFVDFSSTSLISPIAYLPQSIGIFMGRLWNVGPLWLFYMARICNWYAALLLIYFSIRLMPTFKWGLFLTVLSPLVMLQLTSISSNSFILSITFLTIAWIFRFSFARHYSLNAFNITGLFVISMIAFLSHPFHLSLILLCFLIPAYKYGEKQRYFEVSLFYVFCNSLAIAFLGFATYSFLFPFPESSAIDPMLQIQALLQSENNPLHFLMELLHNLFISESAFQLELLPNLSIPLSAPIIYLAALSFVAFFEHAERFEISIKQRTFLLLVILLSFILILTLNYLFSAHLQDTKTSSIELLLFLPLIPCLFMIFQIRWLNLPHFLFVFIIPPLQLFVLFFSILYLLKQNYGFDFIQLFNSLSI